MTKTGATNVPQPTGWSHDPIKGYKTHRTYKGTSKADLAAIEAQLQSGGWAYDVSQEIDTGTDGLWTITAIRGGDKDSPEAGGQDVTTPLSESWELASNLIEKDLLESDSSLIAGIFTDSGNDQDEFDYLIADLKELQNNAKLNYHVLYDTNASAAKVRRLILAGVKYIRVFQPTLRHNKVVTSKYSVKEALTNVGSIIPASKIDALEQVPATLLFNLPQDYHSVRGNVSSTGDILGRSLKYGWYKKPCNVSQQAEGEWQISQEFEWGLWHTDLYTFV